MVSTVFLVRSCCTGPQGISHCVLFVNKVLCPRRERLQNTPQLPTTSFTCVEMLCRTRHNTIDTSVIQRDANKLRGILRFGHRMNVDGRSCVQFVLNGAVDFDCF